jgi:murein DD-endopeptidase MepM/ murein hydrolase activator NlpD
LFPERQLLVRSSERVRSVSFPGWLQAMIIAACIGTVGGVGFLTLEYRDLHRTLDQIASGDTAPLVSARADAASAAIADLQRQLTTINDQYASLKTNYENQQAELASRVAPVNPTVAPDQSNAIAQLSKTLDDARAQLSHSEEQRIAQTAHMQQLENDARAAKTHSDQMKAALDATNTQLQQTVAERDRFRAQLNEKTSMATQLAKPQSAAIAPAQSYDNNPQSQEGEIDNPPVDLPPQLPPSKIGAGERSDNAVSHATGRIEQLLASTGLDVDRLLHRIGSSAPQPAEGGPFIALGDQAKTPVQDTRYTVDLQRLIKTLPLASPLNVSYQIGSPFGARHDPFNGREAFHSGLDLDAPYRTTVYSTAPGTVSFTGVKEGYGKVVDIDHGNGISTRYAHLHRIMVARGQRVGAHTGIGELGSTGRSTGPHLHYEVIVDGRPVDPARFLEVGRNVVQANAR